MNDGDPDLCWCCGVSLHKKNVAAFVTGGWIPVCVTCWEEIPKHYRLEYALKFERRLREEAALQNDSRRTAEIVAALQQLRQSIKAAQDNIANEIKRELRGERWRDSLYDDDDDD